MSNNTRYEYQKQYYYKNYNKIRKRNKDWYDNNKETISKQHKEQYWDNIEQSRIYTREANHRHRRTTKGMASSLISAARCRARLNNLELNFDRKIVYDRITIGTCEMTGIKFSNIPGSPWRPSIDRIDNTQGYTNENIKIVCWLYNNAKNKFTHDDLLILAKHLLDK